MMESIQQIREQLERCRTEQLPVLLRTWQDDPRKGVEKLLQQYRRKYEKMEKELARLEEMLTYEREYGSCSVIAGVDEAGRGPLAGPVVAAAVILPREHKILYLNDSKKLSAARREELYDQIMEEAVSVGVGQASPEMIDEVNILQATYLAMREAVSRLDPGACAAAQ